VEQVSARLSLVLVLGLALCAAGAAGAQSPATGAGASARAYAIRVVAPGVGTSSTPVVSSPPQTYASGGAGFTFNAPDGTTVVTTGSYVATANAGATPNPAATASAEVTDLSLFGGEVTVSDVVGRARASARPGDATGDLTGGGISGLVVDGQAVEPATGRVPLGDWGYAQAMEQSGAAGTGAPPSYHGFVTGLDIQLTADHGGLPAGTEIQVGYAEVSAQAPAATTLPPAPPKQHPKPPKPKKAKKPAKAREPKTIPGVPPSLLPGRLPPKITPIFSTGPYVFPVYGPSSFADTFQAPRGDVSGGWHHGDDIFAPLGAPILAVARGTVFSVGWNDVGGNRLWLRDGQGNEYYYAHLSAYTPAAVNNAHVRAGTVLGFVGNTGDAEGTPYHLHFEIHPVQLLGMGYDGVIDPTPILEQWKHVEDVRFAAAAGWAPSQPGGSSVPQAGAILLQASDISNATGLEPGALEKAASPLLEEGAAGLLGLQQHPPRGPVYDAPGPPTAR
jgi:murein DD-endopeptidase MepM/ murein hydrolase activator NlpD